MGKYDVKTYIAGGGPTSLTIYLELDCSPRPEIVYAQRHVAWNLRGLSRNEAVLVGALHELHSICY